MVLSREQLLRHAGQVHRQIVGDDYVYEALVTRKPDSIRWSDTQGLLDLLGAWKALRWKGGRSLLESVLPRWIDRNSGLLRQLGRVRLTDLIERDYEMILRLAGSLKEEGIKSTCTGKLLHFLLPQTIMLWDGAVIRAGYELDDDPYEFVRYQAYARRLARLVGADDIQVEEQIVSAHRRDVGRTEPLTKILDEFGYVSAARRVAVDSLGGRQDAFRVFSG